MIRFEGVGVRYGSSPALEGVDLAVEAGELCVLVGPSGSGKSTLLRLVNRLVGPAEGRVLVRGRDVAGEDPARLRRSIGYAIQSVGLFPHRSVAQNIATVPRLLGWPRGRVEARVEAMLALVRLDPGLAGRFPRELSGGQAQRVGLARALAAGPDILLMDEPFGAVDPVVRRELRGELGRIHRETGATVLLVTHDPAEALEVATRLVVMREGRVVAEGRPAALALAPDPFVAGFLGPDLALARLDALPAGALARPGEAVKGLPAIAGGASLREALALMLGARAPALRVHDAQGATLGTLRVDDLIVAAPERP